MSKDEIIERLIQEGHDPDRARREVDLAEVAWNVEPDGWELSDLWFLAPAMVSVATFCCQDRARSKSIPDISESDPATVRE